MKKFYDIKIDSQVELENGKTLGKLEESKISVNDGNCGSVGGGPVVTLYASSRQGPNGGYFLVFNQDDQNIAFNPNDPRIASSDDIIKLFNSGLVIISNFGVYAIMNEITRQMAAEGLYVYAVHSTGNGASSYRFITRDFVPEDDPPA